MIACLSRVLQQDFRVHEFTQSSARDVKSTRLLTCKQSRTFFGFKRYTAYTHIQVVASAQSTFRHLLVKSPTPTI